jgi:hypothetical protein
MLTCLAVCRRSKARINEMDTAQVRGLENFANERYRSYTLTVSLITVCKARNLISSAVVKFAGARPFHAPSPSTAAILGARPDLGNSAIRPRSMKSVASPFPRI